MGDMGLKYHNALPTIPCKGCTGRGLAEYDDVQKERVAKKPLVLPSVLLRSEIESNPGMPRFNPTSGRNSSMSDAFAREK